jgi:hypothetical protein
LELHSKRSRNKNKNLIAFRIPLPLSVTLRKLGLDPKEICLNALIQSVEQKQAHFNEKGGFGTVGSEFGSPGEIRTPVGGSKVRDGRTYGSSTSLRH